MEAEVAPAAGTGNPPGYEWVALSVTTVGALLAAVQGSSLIIALPDVLTGLDLTFLTIVWVLLGHMLITTALVPVVGRLAVASVLRPSHSPREAAALAQPV